MSTTKVPDEARLHEIARLCAFLYGEGHAYTRTAGDEAWRAHDWVIEAMKAAMNQVDEPK